MRYLFAFILLFVCLDSYSQKLDTSEVYFELNFAKVSTMASMTLDSLWFAKVVAPGKKTSLLGYGDYLGTDEYNLALSQRRVKNVKDYLVALGLNEQDLIECVGKGRIKRTPVPGELGFYKDRKVMIITQHASKKAEAVKSVVKKEEPKAVPVAAVITPKKVKPAKQEAAPKMETAKPVVKKEEPKPIPAPPAPKKTEPVKPVAKKEEPKPVPAPPVAKKTEPIVKKEEPKPVPAPAPKKAEPVKPIAAAKPEPKPQPVATAKTADTKTVMRRPEKDITTLDPAKLVVNEVIPVNNIFFAPGSNAMMRKSQPALEQLFKFLNDNPNLSVEIQGHICCLDPTDGTDEPDGLGGNRSEGRAKNIYIFLISKGVNKSRLRYVGLGNTKPAVYPERTDFERELKNRATLKITGK